MKTMNMISVNDVVEVEWLDSYGVQSGWQDISEYTAGPVNVKSWGKVIYHNNDVIALAHNFSEETEKTFKQANGIMVIPKACIQKVTCVSCGLEPASEQKPQQT